ncbi:MAG: EAL domain-containing protein [Rhizobiaceae bacterium]
MIVSDINDQIVARADVNKAMTNQGIDKEILIAGRKIAKNGETVFSKVMASKSGSNIMLAVRRHDENIAIAVINTKYFVKLGKSIAFGKKGHAAIVDSIGNVLSHPLDSWIAERKNIAKVSAVQRMMNGETGIEQFYSPALKGDMIAGLTSVKGPGWGVMIPQPVEELYDKVFDNNKTILMTLGVGFLIAIFFTMMLVNSLAYPIEQLLRSMRRNARNQKLSKTEINPGLIPIKEIGQFNQNYNDMLSQVSIANDKIVTLAYTDTVTGLPNRDKLRELMTGLLGDDVARGQGGSLLFVDLDDFKQINDLHGHTVGDKFLRDCAAKLKQVTVQHHQQVFDNRPTAAKPILARIGGDEFVIIFPGLTKVAETKRFMKKLSKEMNKPSDKMACISKRSVSIGCSRFPNDGESLGELLKFADIAMCHAKKSGKGNYEVYSAAIGTMTTSEIRGQVETAISEGQLVLEYQPKVRAGDHKVTGVEALVRWDHPILGRIPPNEWIPAISNSPVIKQLGEWVIARAMDDHRKWVSLGLNLSVAVNIGSEHFCSADIVGFLGKTAKEKGFAPHNMELEITEDAIFSSDANVEKAINALHQCGYKIAIDDFGIGYSNIARLCSLPVDSLKIDRSVIINAGKDRRVSWMMKCIVSMADKLGCETVA